MTMGQLFFSPRGRIGRAQWWLAMIALGIVSALGLIVNTFVTRSYGFAAGRVVMGLWGAWVLYLAYCVMAKRFQDERPVWALVAIAPGGLQIVLDLAEASYPLSKHLIIMGNLALLIARSLLAIVLVVLLRCQRGTIGDNRYGQDPVLSAAPSMGG